MTSSRSTVLIAIAFGAVVGASGALMSARTGPETRAEPPPSNTAAPAASPATDSVGPAAPAATSSTPQQRPDPVAEALVPLRTDASVLRHTELGCARGNPDNCLLVGDYYSRGRQNDHARRALIYRRRAIVLYAQKCHGRWPAACRVLSSLYDKGIGVPRNNRIAEALLERSLELCKAQPKRPCMRQGADVPPDLR